MFARTSFLHPTFSRSLIFYKVSRNPKSYKTDMYLVTYYKFIVQFLHANAYKLDIL